MTYCWIARATFPVHNQSTQPERTKLMEPPTPVPDKLCIENFRLVKKLADKVHFLKVQQEHNHCFLAHMERIRDQRQQAHWWGPVPTLSLLPGAAIFAQDIHIKRSALIGQKYEGKLLKLVISSLPSAIDGVEEKKSILSVKQVFLKSDNKSLTQHKGDEQNLFMASFHIKCIYIPDQRVQHRGGRRLSSSNPPPFVSLLINNNFSKALLRATISFKRNCVSLSLYTML